MEFSRFDRSGGFFSLSSVRNIDFFKRSPFIGGRFSFGGRDGRSVVSGIHLRPIGAGLSLLQRVALGVYLKALAGGSQSEFRRYCAAVPFHKGSADLEDFLAVVANDLGLVSILFHVGNVVLEIGPDIHFASEIAFYENREGTVYGGSRDGTIDFAGFV